MRLVVLFLLDKEILESFRLVRILPGPLETQRRYWIRKPVNNAHHIPENINSLYFSNCLPRSAIIGLVGPTRLSSPIMLHNASIRIDSVADVTFILNNNWQMVMIPLYPVKWILASAFQTVNSKELVLDCQYLLTLQHVSVELIDWRSKILPARKTHPDWLEQAHSSTNGLSWTLNPELWTVKARLNLENKEKNR